MILIVKAIHIIAVVCWFAGLFYFGRLLVYIRECLDLPKEERRVLHPHLSLMAQRVRKMILIPSAMIAIIVGFVLLGMTGMMQQNWMILKLVLVVVLIAYQVKLGVFGKRLYLGEQIKSSRFFRIFNEVPALLLILIVFLVETKNIFLSLVGLLGSCFFVLTIVGCVRLMKRS